MGPPPARAACTESKEAYEQVTDHDVIREDVEFLLLLSLDIDVAVEAHPVKQKVRLGPCQGKRGR